MDENLHGLFTEIGCIMEDASIIALFHKGDDKRDIAKRAGDLRAAYNRIGALLKTIESKAV